MYTEEVNGLNFWKVNILNTHLHNTVHRSDVMSLSTVVRGRVFIKRTCTVFIGRFVQNFHKNGAFRNLGGVRSGDRFANTGNIPVKFNGNSDCRSRYLCAEKDIVFLLSQANVFKVKINTN